MKCPSSVIEPEIIDGGWVQDPGPGHVHRLLVRVGEVDGIGAGIRKHARVPAVVAIVYVPAGKPVLIAQGVVDLPRVEIMDDSHYVVGAKVVAAGDAVGWPVG